MSNQQPKPTFDVDATMRACIDGVRQAHADKAHLQRVENMLYDSRRSNEQLRDSIAALHRELGDLHKAKFEQRQHYTKIIMLIVLVYSIVLLVSLSF